MPFLAAILTETVILAVAFLKNWSLDPFHFEQGRYLYSLQQHILARKNYRHFVSKKSISKLVLAKVTGRTTQEPPLKPTDPGGWDSSQKLRLRFFSYYNLITLGQSSVYKQIQKKILPFRLAHWIHTCFLLIWVWAPRSRVLLPEKVGWLKSTSPCEEPIHRARYAIYQIKSKRHT